MKILRSIHLIAAFSQTALAFGWNPRASLLSSVLRGKRDDHDAKLQSKYYLESDAEELLDTRTGRSAYQVKRAETLGSRADPCLGIDSYDTVYIRHPVSGQLLAACRDCFTMKYDTQAVAYASTYNDKARWRLLRDGDVCRIQNLADNTYLSAVQNAMINVPDVFAVLLGEKENSQSNEDAWVVEQRQDKRYILRSLAGGVLVGTPKLSDASSILIPARTSETNEDSAYAGWEILAPKSSYGRGQYTY